MELSSQSSLRVFSSSPKGPLCPCAVTLIPTASPRQSLTFLCYVSLSRAIDLPFRKPVDISLGILIFTIKFSWISSF